MSRPEPPTIDQPYFAWRAQPAWPKLAWPDNARLALCVVVSIEHYEMHPPAGTTFPSSLPGGFGRAPYPDFRTFSHREYGNRIGVFRVIDALAKFGIRATAAVDARTAKAKPAIVEQCLKHDWEIAAHGQAVTRMVSSAMTEQEERSYISEALRVIESACGRRPTGWHGPEYGESIHTPTILAELGIAYVLDWPNDELPFRMATPAGTLISLPMLVDFDDVFAHWHRKLSMSRWCKAISDALDRLLKDGGESPRMLILNLHPWLIGQPWRISYLEEVLSDIRGRSGIWHATAAEVAAHASVSI